MTPWTSCGGYASAAALRSATEAYNLKGLHYDIGYEKWMEDVRDRIERDIGDPVLRQKLMSASDDPGRVRRMVTDAGGTWTGFSSGVDQGIQKVTVPTEWRTGERWRLAFGESATWHAGYTKKMSKARKWVNSGPEVEKQATKQLMGKAARKGVGKVMGIFSAMLYLTMAYDHGPAYATEQFGRDVLWMDEVEFTGAQVKAYSDKYLKDFEKLVLNTRYMRDFQEAYDEALGYPE